MLQIDQSVSNSERYKYRTEAKVKVSLPAIKQYLRDETTGGSIQHLCHKAGFVTQNVLYYLRKGEIPESIFIKVFGEIPELREYMEKYEKMMTIIEPAEQPKQTTEAMTTPPLRITTQHRIRCSWKSLRHWGTRYSLKLTVRISAKR